MNTAFCILLGIQALAFLFAAIVILAGNRRMTVEEHRIKQELQHKIAVAQRRHGPVAHLRRELVNIVCKELRA